MDKQNVQKWVNFSYLMAAALVGFVLFVAMQKLSGVYDLEVRIRNVELIVRIVSIVVGAITFAVLYKHEQVNRFMNEVVVELSRVTWPTQKETSSATVIVIIMVMISGLILGFLDYVWTKVVQLII